MQLRSFSVSFLVAGVIIGLSAGAARAGGCLRDTRQSKVDQTNVARLLGYLCTSDLDVQTRIRVQFQRLSGLATGVVLNGGSSPWLPTLYGNYQVANNDVLKEYKTLMSRFGSAVRQVYQGGESDLALVAGPTAQAASGELSNTALLRSGQVVRSFELAPLPDIPLIDEALQILNEQTWPASLQMSYDDYPMNTNASLAAAISLWRNLNAADARQYAERIRRYNALVVDRSFDERKALPRSMELLNYLTASGWPENFLYASTYVADSEGCMTLDFRVNQYSFEVEIAVIENVSSRPITISQLFGQTGGDNQLRRAVLSPRMTGKQVLPSEPITLAPSSRLIVPLRLLLAADESARPSEDDAASQAERRKAAQATFRKIMAHPPGTVFKMEIYSTTRGMTRGKNGTYVIKKVRESFKPPSYPTKSNFAFGPEWTLTGLALGGETIAFDAAPSNVISITVSGGAGSCPILYAWDARAATWIRHGKVLHQAQTSMREASETLQFEGLVHRFRIAEEELERATIRQVLLRLDLSDGRALMLRPEPQPAEQDAPQAADHVAELYANDEIEFTFALPADLDAAQVIRSSFTVSGYYDRYSALLASTPMTRVRPVGN
jgi:hypothetical protein